MELQRDTETETVHVDNRLFFWVRCEFICVTHVAPSEKINKQLKERKKLLRHWKKCAIGK